jgi:HlyD family secretion protein
MLLLIAAGSWLGYQLLQPEPVAAQVVYGSGRIEADEVRIAPQVAGKLLEHVAREGDTVQAGQVVARIDSTDLELTASQAEAQRKATAYSTRQVDAQIRLADHHAMTAQGDLARYEALRRAGWATIPQLDVRRNAYVAAVDQASALRQQRAQTIAQTEVAARSLALARQQLGKTVVRAPLSGSVLERLAEPGEVLAAGQPLAVVADLRKVRLRVFASEADLGKIRLGSPARIRVDAFANREFPARVARVDAQAQFTPRDVHMADERVRTVYGVLLEADNPTGLLKPGMPADAWILWNRTAGWPARLTVPE